MSLYVPPGHDMITMLAGIGIGALLVISIQLALEWVNDAIDEAKRSDSDGSQDH